MGVSSGYRFKRIVPLLVSITATKDMISPNVIVKNMV